MIRFRFSILALTLLMVGTANAQRSAHRTQQHHSQATAPEMAIALDNEAVQVVRVHLDAHQKIPMHDLTPRVVIWLTDAHLRATRPDGSVHDERGTPGQVDWVPAQRHAAENLDDHPVEFVAVIP